MSLISASIYAGTSPLGHLNQFLILSLIPFFPLSLSHSFSALLGSIEAGNIAGGGCEWKEL